MKSHTNKSDQDNHNAYVSQYLKKRRQTMEFGQFIKVKWEIFS